MKMQKKNIKVQNYETRTSHPLQTFRGTPHTVRHTPRAEIPIGN